MAENRYHLNWILSEIPKLCSQDLIDRETALKLEAHYREKLLELPSRQKIFSFLVCIIGILMISGGIILFFNHNWDMFPKAVRIGISALPLLVGAGISYFTLIREKSQLWHEGSAILTATGTAVLIAMLSQIYHINTGDFAGFMFLVLLLSVPVLYIFNSIGLVTLYVFFSFSVNYWTASSWQNGVVILCILPFFLRHLRKDSPYLVWCRYLMLPAALSAALGCGGYFTAAALILISSYFFIAGMDLLSEKQALFKNPWLFPGLIGEIIFLAVASSIDKPFKAVKTFAPEQLWTFWSFIALGGMILIVLLFQKHLTRERIFPVLPVVITFLPLWIDFSFWRLIYNICFGLGGILYLHSGFTRRSILLFNGGALMIVVLMTCRFFDADIGLLYRAFGFILLGLGFIAANIFYNRRQEVEK